MAKKPQIWIEVSCCNCGHMEGFNYRNAKSISELKNITTNWEFNSELVGNLCPDCIKLFKAGKTNYQIRRKRA